MHDLVLTTPRLVLRPVAPADREALNRWMNDWRVVATLAAPVYPHPMIETDGFIADSQAAAVRGEACRLALLAVGECVGVASIDVGATGDVLGYWLAPTHWGRGLMTEAAGALVDGWFAVRRSPAIRSGVFAGNDRSLRVQERLGFRLVGESRIYSRPLGREERRLDRADWAGRQPAARITPAPMAAS